MGAARWPIEPSGAAAWTLLAVVTGGLLAGALVATDARLGVLAVASIMGLALLQSATARMLFVVVGGMGVLQSSPSLDAAKLVYFTGVGVAVGAAWMNRAALRSQEGRLLRPLVEASGLATAFLTLTIVVAYAHGTSLESWLRDAAPYFLIASVPVLAVDVASSRTAPRLILPLFVAVGLLSGLSFATEWLTRRGLSELPLERLLLPTGAPAAALFCYSTSKVFYSRKFPVSWGAVVLLLPGLALLTATRSTLVWFVGPLAILARQRGLMTRASLRVVIVAVIAVIAVQQVGSAVSGTVDVDRVTARLTQVASLPAQLESDQSYVERRAETTAAWDAFWGNVAFGTGPGAVIEWSVASHANTESFNVDTGLSYLAKFGIVGAAVAVIFVIGFARAWRSLRLPAGCAAVSDAVVGFGVIILMRLPLANPLEDKGVSFAILLLLALALSGVSSAESTFRATEVT